MRAHWIGVGVLALLYGVALVLLRGEPSVASDQGVFLSVAARMLDGDRLYAEVVDNKDPLFFYTYAAALGIGGWRGPFALDALWLAIAGLSSALLLRELRAPRAAVVTGFLLYPLALTAGWYLVGMSMLAALAVAPLVPWLWLRGAFVASGVALAGVMLFKLNLSPLAVATVGALVLVGSPASRRGRALARGFAGLGGALLVAAVVLALRGELAAYLETVTYNVHYAGALSESESTVGRTVDHLRVAFDFFHLAGRWQLPVALLALLLFALAAGSAWRRTDSPSARPLVAVTAAALLGTGVVVASTAYWEHHLELLAYPATLVAATLVAVSHTRFSRRVGIGLATILVAFGLWSSLKADGGLEVSTAWRTKPISAGAIALERARTGLGPSTERVSYVVLGSNSENGHAAFIGDPFDLVCRWFQLYPFSRSEQLDETLTCVERENPSLVLVTLGFESPQNGTPWSAFVADARALLEREYQLVEEEHPGFQVWRRKDAQT